MSGVPYDLMIVDDNQAVVFIDVEEHQWHAKYSEWMRRPGWWLLRRKSDSAIVLTVRVNPGDQPYYTARHVGIAGSGGSNDVICYGIGKKTPAVYEFDEQTDARGDPMPKVRRLVRPKSEVRLWVMPDGVVVGGDDVDQLGILQVKARGPR